jgi:hypothetical protein
VIPSNHVGHVFVTGGDYDGELVIEASIRAQEGRDRRWLYLTRS